MKNNGIISDWVDYCSGRKDFEYEYFFDLLNYDLSASELKVIVDSFPNSTDLLDRIHNVKEGRKGASSSGVEECSEHSLVKAAKESLDELRIIVDTVGEKELLEIIDNADVTFCKDKNDFERWSDSSDSPYIWLYDLVGDYVRGHRVIEGEAVRAFSEAAYGMTNDAYLAWYVCEPLLNVPATFAKYFEMWKLGGNHVLTTDALLVSRESA